MVLNIFNSQGVIRPLQNICAQKVKLNLKHVFVGRYMGCTLILDIKNLLEFNHKCTK